MAIEAIVRHMLSGRIPLPGARAATNDLQLSDYEELFRHRTIYTGRRQELSATTNPPLYQKILGDAWQQLPLPIQNMHSLQNAISAEGKANVVRGKGLAGLIADLFHFPKAGSDISINVNLSARDGKEYWRRTFAGKSFLSLQSAGKGRYQHLICEQFGPFTFGLAVLVANNQLQLVVRRWNIFGMPLPLFLAPRERSYESVEDGKFHFHVEISLPILGLIVKYQGWLLIGP